MSKGSAETISITVIDAPCGAGKTTWAISKINGDKGGSYIYCTPFLDEITRVRNECGKWRFSEPHNFETTKIDDFNTLLADGSDIAVTHSTFLNATPATLELLRQGEYTLLLDEVLDAVVDFNDVLSVKNAPKQSVTKEDIENILLPRKLINVDDRYRVSWTGGNYVGTKYEELGRLADLGRLYCVHGSMLTCVFPPEMFQCFREVFVMTYLFGGRPLKGYFDAFRIPYQVQGVTREEATGAYMLQERTKEAEREFRQKVKRLITVCDNRRLNGGYKVNSLSKTWFDNNMKKSDAVKRLKTDLHYFFTRVAYAKSGQGDIMWTCPKSYERKLRGDGYTRIRGLTVEERKLPDKKQDELKTKLSCFVSLNARATNDFRERWALAYCYNMYPPLTLDSFFYDYCGTHIDSDLFGISCLIQWIWRSRIRDNKPIVIYIPSPRMRSLFNKWIDCEI